MVHYAPDPHSDGSEDTQATITAHSLDRQAEARAAYIESILADWPAPTPRQERTIGSLLGNGTPWISEREYQSLEYRRYLDNETPGKFGFFTAKGEAA